MSRTVKLLLQQHTQHCIILCPRKQMLKYKKEFAVWLQYQELELNFV